MGKGNVTVEAAFFKSLELLQRRVSTIRFNKASALLSSLAVISIITGFTCTLGLRRQCKGLSSDEPRHAETDACIPRQE
jgi:hypothetical protein